MAVIFQLAHTGVVSAYDVGRVVALFIPIWMVWAHATFYMNLFDTDDLAHRFFAYLYFLGVGTARHPTPAPARASTTNTRAQT